MENYFQAEAFNLDKWSQILAPPAHFLSLNPALALTPDPRDGDSPLPFKTLPAPDPSSSESQGPDTKRHPAAKPPSWGEERPDRPADVHSPPLPQPNIGKLVGGEEGLSPPVPASSSPPPYHLLALENGCSSTSPSSPASPALNGLSEEPCEGNHTRVTPVNPSNHHQPPAPSDPRPDAPVEGRGGERSGGSSHISQTHFTHEEKLGGDRRVAVEESNPRLEPESTWAGSPIQESGREEAEMSGGQSQDTGERGQRTGGWRGGEQGEASGERGQRTGGWRGGEQGEASGERGQNEGRMEGLRGRKKECRKSSQKEKKGEMAKRGGQDGEMSLTNGLATTGGGEERGSRAEGEGWSLTPPPSKEDSVTEEKEMEESKQEKEGGGGGSSFPSKLNNSRLQPVSLPFGGARPKQPVSLKLQIPRPLYEQVQNQLEPSANTAGSITSGGKNKNLENRGSAEVTDTATVVALGDPGGGGGGGVVKGELLSGECQTSSLGLVVASESSPDNDFQAGQHHQGALPRKQLSSLGDVAPVWVPDSQAPVCMKCEARFTFTKRRHHCRACGKGTCGGSNQSPNPNNPAEYCSTIPPLQQVQASGALASLPTVMVPVGVPKTPGSEGSLAREQRRVWFADGILPNGEAAESPKPHSQCSNKFSAADSSEASSPAPAAPVGSPVGSSVSLIPEDGLPPILTSTGVKGDYAVEERPSEIVLMQQLEEGDVNRKCWYVTSKGMHAVGQAEVVVLLQCLPDEKSIPKDLFSHFVQLYQEALTGKVLTHLGHSFFTQSFLGSREHGGFLYVSPSFQALQDLMLPNPPYLFGVLLQKWETPWAKAFPIRLMLRLGAEKPLFGETGHTIMNLLADFRNYQYTLPMVKGLVVDMEVKKTCIKIPSNRYNEVRLSTNHITSQWGSANQIPPQGELNQSPPPPPPPPHPPPPPPPPFA
ncbi:unnamed protein product, partial [Coregonus sp. 'balchen']